MSMQYSVTKGLDKLLSGVASLEDYFCQSTPPVVIKPSFVEASAPSAKAISCDRENLGAKKEKADLRVCRCSRWQEHGSPMPSLPREIRQALSIKNHFIIDH